MIRPILALCAALALTGCAMQGPISQMGVDYNEAVARIFDEQTLLNIIRAKERMPQHYTSVSGLSGELDVQLNANVTGTANDGKREFSPTVGGLVSTGSNINISVEDAQDFYRGITNAIEEPIVAHYLRQGWSSRLIASLLVEKVEFLPYGKPLERPFATFRNDPRSGRFANLLDCFDLVADSDGGRQRKLFIKSDKLGDLNLKGLLDTNLSRVRSNRDKGENAIDLSGTKPEKIEISLPRDYPLILAPNFASQHCNMERDYRKMVATPKTVDVQITVRSVDSAIYFVGEYLRVLETENRERAEQAYAINGDPLFRVYEGSERNAAITASLLGKRYFVPRDLNERGRTTQVIALLQQLMNIHKSSADRPNTVPVRLQRF